MAKQLLLTFAFFFVCASVCVGQTAATPDSSTNSNMPRVTVNFKNESLTEALKQIARKANIGISFRTGIIPDKKVTYTAVDKNVYNVINDLLEGTRLYLELSKNREVILIKKEPQSYTVSGFVRDASSGEVLIGANIYNTLEQNGVATNEYGFFSYTTHKDSVNLVITYVGYQTKSIQLHLEEDVKLTVRLQSAVEELAELTVTAEKSIEEETLMSTITVPVEQIKNMPHILGEVDVLKALQLMPGVQGGTEGTSGLYVRGGEPGQNLILLDGVPVYNPSHLMGFVSVFNADAINNVKLVKGGFPARYGGRLSSVIDIRLKEGNTYEIHGAGSIGLLAAKLMVNGPVTEDMTFLVSGRRTYIDLLARPFIDEKAGYYFYDLIGKTSYTLNENNRFYLSGYFGNDRGYYTDPGREFGIRWGNIITSLRWNHIYNPKLFSNLTLTYSRYRFSVYTIDQSGGETNEIKYLSGIRDFAASVDFDYFPSPNHNIKFGVGITRHRFKPGVFTEISGLDEEFSLTREETYTLTPYIYFEDTFELTDKLKFNAGFRASGNSVNNEFFYSLQPRISFNYLLPGDIALKGSYSRMTQYIHLLTNSGIGLPTDLWVPATPRVEPQHSRQWALGLAKSYKGYEISLQAYYKTMKNVIAYKEGATYISIQDDWQDKVLSGEGESYGAELLIQKKAGKWSGWLGYALSWSNRQFEQLNFGRPFPYRYDRRHDFNVVVNYTPWKGLTLSGTFVFATGEAITLPTAYYGKGRFGTIKYYEGRNSFRMRPYHRLDLSISWTEDNGGWNRTWAVSVYNVYNRKNPFFINIEPTRTGRQFVQYSLFPIIPSVSYRIDF